MKRRVQPIDRMKKPGLAVPIATLAIPFMAAVTEFGRDHGLILIYAGLYLGIYWCLLCYWHRRNQEPTRAKAWLMAIALSHLAMALLILHPFLIIFVHLPVYFVALVVLIQPEF